MTSFRGGGGVELSLSDRTTGPLKVLGAAGRARDAGRERRSLFREARNTLVRCGYSRPGGCSPLLETLQETITTLIGDYGYVAIFVLMVLESACIPIPSEVTMLFGGALASPGFAAPGHELDLVLVALVGTLGNLVGSWLAYGAGAAGGRPLVDRFGRYLLVLPHEVDRAHEWFERRGELTVFVSRLLPVIRTFISLPAGVARMPFWPLHDLHGARVPAVDVRAGVARATCSARTGRRWRSSCSPSRGRSWCCW